MADHPLADEYLLKLLPHSAEGDPIIGGMHLKSRLGSGAMGAVFKGHHPRLNVPVAVKILAPSQGSKENNERAARWFQREAQLLWQVQSTNVVRVSDVGQDEASGLQYMVMDYVRGMTAAEFVEHYNNFMLQPTTTVEVEEGEGAVPTWQNGLDEIIAVRICLAAARGMEAIHEKNIIHRDIKPDNILIPYRADYTKELDITQLDFDKAQLVDLGVARHSDEAAATQRGLIVGTPAFMPPEQAQGEDPQKPSDVYSLGATLYYLLAGRAPFSGRSHAVVLKVLTETPQPIENLVPRLSHLTRDLIVKTMQKAAADRYADGRELRRALERVTAELPTQAGDLGMFTLPALSAVAKAVNPDAPAPAGKATAPTAAGQPGTAKHPPVKVTTGPRTSGHKLPSGDLPAAPGAAPVKAAAARRGTGPQKPVTGGHPSGGGDGKPATGAQPNTGARGKTRKAGPVTGGHRTAGKGSSSTRAAAPAGSHRAPAVGAATTMGTRAPAEGARAQPGVSESANWLPPEEDPLKREREALSAAEMAQQRMEEVYSAWAALPIAVWGGLTAAGCFYHGAMALGVLLALVTVAGCALPFVLGGKLRRLGVVIGAAFSLGGYWLLAGVGDILTGSPGRVFGAKAATETLGASIIDWLNTAVLALLWLLMAGAWYFLTRYFLDENKRRQLTAERARLGVE